MQQIVPIRQTEINGAEVNSVNARELWEALESKQRYADWIKSRIEKYGFTENEDYIVFHKNMKNPNGGRPTQEYIITIDMAKELAMVENNEKGRQARRYFIEVEKRAKQNIYQLPQSFSEALRLAADLEEKNQKLLAQNNEMKPKALFADSVSQSHTSILIGQFAKAISNENFKIGQNRLFEWLRDNGYLIRGGQRHNQPMQKYIDNGYFEVSERTINNPDGSTRITITTKITGKGQVALTSKIMDSLSLKSA